MLTRHVFVLPIATLPSTNIAPVGGYLEDRVPLVGTPCQVPCGSEGIPSQSLPSSQAQIPSNLVLRVPFCESPPILGRTRSRESRSAASPGTVAGAIGNDRVRVVAMNRFWEFPKETIGWMCCLFHFSIPAEKQDKSEQQSQICQGTELLRMTDMALVLASIHKCQRRIYPLWLVQPCCLQLVSICDLLLDRHDQRVSHAILSEYSTSPSRNSVRMSRPQQYPSTSMETVGKHDILLKLKARQCLCIPSSIPSPGGRGTTVGPTARS